MVDQGKFKVQRGCSDRELQLRSNILKALEESIRNRARIGSCFHFVYSHLLTNAKQGNRVFTLTSETAYTGDEPAYLAKEMAPHLKTLGMSFEAVGQYSMVVTIG